jgi:hypothetical protein
MQKARIDPRIVSAQNCRVEFSPFRKEDMGIFPKKTKDTTVDFFDLCSSKMEIEIFLSDISVAFGLLSTILQNCILVVYTISIFF